jgi:tRNA-splicing ligase RtcB
MIHPLGMAPCLYEIPTTFRSDMRVPARIFADEAQLTQMMHDRSLEQLVNVTTLPGIVDAALGMPDMHEGYGFPVGGVAATRLPDGVISPGGIGFDINCGVRLLASGIDRHELEPHKEAVVHEISRAVPTGTGRRGAVQLSNAQMDRLLEEGVPAAIDMLDAGSRADLERIESGGALPGAAAAHVSERARERGHDQLGTLGSGNHFVEVQAVTRIYDERAAAAFGLTLGAVTVLIHTGSRGLGHQVCTDYVRVMDEAAARHGIHLPDRQLACVPLSTTVGQNYFAAMCAAANFAFCNRQIIARTVRRAFERILGPHVRADLALVYDVAHNTAKIERFGARTLCVHRKGATRALGPSSLDVPPAYRGVGQPVFIPGSMGTASFVLVGTDASSTVSLASTCHGAGRTLSRGAAKRTVAGHELRKQLEARGIVVRCPSNPELAEEAPVAYKDVDQVVETVECAGIARKVARLEPLGVVKG